MRATQISKFIYGGRGEVRWHSKAGFLHSSPGFKSDCWWNRMPPKNFISFKTWVYLKGPSRRWTYKWCEGLVKIIFFIIRSPAAAAFPHQLRLSKKMFWMRSWWSLKNCFSAAASVEHGKLFYCAHLSRAVRPHVDGRRVISSNENSSNDISPFFCGMKVSPLHKRHGFKAN